MRRRTLAALLIAALLGAQPGVRALAGEVGKTVPVVGNVSAGSGLSSLPKIELNVSPALTLPSVPAAGLGAEALIAPEATLSASYQQARQASVEKAALPLAQAVQRFSVMAGLRRLGGFFAAKEQAAEQAAQGGASQARNPESGGQALSGFFDGEKVKVILTEHGAQPVELDAAGVKSYLQANPGYEARLRTKGRIRLIASKSKNAVLTPANAIAAGRELAKAGLVAPIVAERIQVAPPTPVVRESVLGEAGAAPKAEHILKRALLFVPREVAYLARTLKASAGMPTTSEVVGGVVSKGPAFGMSVAWYAKLMLPLHPVAFGAAVAFSFALETFHGVFINTWQNLQNFIGRQRGIVYQTVFNLAYMQLTSAIARIIAWAAIPATIAPWQLQYWVDMGIVTLVGTFVGTLGFQGLNDLYNKGLLSRGQRSAIQQARDLFFLLAGVFFASGSMGIFWPIFIAQQSIDFGLFLFSHFARARPIAYVAESAVAASPEFRSMYPVVPGPRRSPLENALDALPFYKLIKDKLTARRQGK